MFWNPDTQLWNTKSLSPDSRLFCNCKSYKQPDFRFEGGVRDRMHVHVWEEGVEPILFSSGAVEQPGAVTKPCYIMMIPIDFNVNSPPIPTFVWTLKFQVINNGNCTSELEKTGEISHTSDLLAEIWHVNICGVVKAALCHFLFTLKWCL